MAFWFVALQDVPRFWCGPAGRPILCMLVAGLASSRSTGHALVNVRRRRCDVREHHQMSNMSVDSEIKESQ